MKQKGLKPKKRLRQRLESIKASSEKKAYTKFKKAVRELSDSHIETIAEATTSFNKEIESLKTEHDLKIKTIKEEHELFIKEKDIDFDKKITILKNEHSIEISNLKKEVTDKIRELDKQKDRLDTLEDEKVGHNNNLKQKNAVLLELIGRLYTKIVGLKKDFADVLDIENTLHDVLKNGKVLTDNGEKEVFDREDINSIVDSLKKP